MNEIKKCSACNNELKKNKKLFCKDKCQREYTAYRTGKKKFNEMFVSLSGKRQYTINPKKIKIKIFKEKRKRGRPKIYKSF